MAGERYVSPYFFATIYAGLSDTYSALAQLERGFTQRTSPLIYINVDPVFSGLHWEPRFRTC